MNNPSNDLISRAVAVAIADARLSDVPEHVDLEDDRNLFAAGYLAAAGSIKAALQRATRAATPPETPSAAAMRAAREIVEKTKCDEYRGGPHRTIMAADAVAAIITRHLPVIPVRQEWLPIETAPRDSSWILGLTQSRRQVVVRWGGGTWEDDNRLCRDPLMWQPLPAAATTSPETPVTESELVEAFAGLLTDDERGLMEAALDPVQAAGDDEGEEPHPGYDCGGTCVIHAAALRSGEGT